MQRPSIGRTVHYISLGSADGKFPPEIQAATITGVYRQFGEGALFPGRGNNDPDKLGVAPANAVTERADTTLVDLKVQYRTGLFDMRCVPFSEVYERGHWSWPPRDQA